MTTLPPTYADAYAQMVKVFALLRQTSSISVVSGYLKEKGLTSSAGSWDELFTKRIEPAFQANKISLKELTDLLRNAEESGRQHVFLYTCKAAHAKTLIDESSVLEKLAGKGLASLATAPLMLTEAPVAQIVDVRWVSGRLLVKIVGQRTVQELDSSVQSEEGIIDKRYKLVQKRVVHLFRLSPNGVLELRVASHSTSTRYTEDITMLFGMVDFLMESGDFKPISLLKAKEYIWVNQATLSDRVRLIDSLMKNNDGFALHGLATWDGGNIGKNRATQESLEKFRGQDGYCDGHILGFLPRGTPLFPTKEIRVLLRGLTNEFAIPAKCSHTEFEYIFDEVRAFNA